MLTCHRLYDTPDRRRRPRPRHQPPRPRGEGGENRQADRVTGPSIVAQPSGPTRDAGLESQKCFSRHPRSGTCISTNPMIPLRFTLRRQPLSQLPVAIPADTRRSRARPEPFALVSRAAPCLDLTSLPYEALSSPARSRCRRHPPGGPQLGAGPARRRCPRGARGGGRQARHRVRGAPRPRRSRSHPRWQHGHLARGHLRLPVPVLQEVA